MPENDIQIATFGAGCFWQPDEEFRRLTGVVETTVGYMGGTTAQPIYEQVCAGNTGHVEVVQVKYDPEKITYAELLNKFWEIHDPTQVNRQGADVGWQYRSVIFYHDQKQHQIAEQSQRNMGISGKYHEPIATKIESASKFWPAEEYHQKYLAKRGLRSCPI